MLQLTSPKLSVIATLPIDGKALMMETTRPADVREVGRRGWPALVHNLQVSDTEGHYLEANPIGVAGWELKKPYRGLVRLAYEVDYSGPAADNWPAPRETAFADANNFVFVGRSLFITTSEVRTTQVTFALPRPWRPVTPWRTNTKSGNVFDVAEAKDLVNNLLVMTRVQPAVLSASGFQVFVTLLGNWPTARSEVNRVLRGVIPFFVQLMGSRERDSYSVVLLPIEQSDETGAESYRRSFAFTFNAAPTRANRSVWGKTIAHEIFHSWNGWRLRGADYASSQWFQEGFTEYAANMAMVGSGLITPDEFLQQLSTHIHNYQKLTTPLDAPGTHKGPPLYSGGALVAFCWDLQIRQASAGKRNLGDFLRTLWRQTHNGQRAYEWRDIRVALDSTAQLDWEGFYRDYIKGTKPIPLAQVLPHAGLRLVQTGTAAPVIQPDPSAPITAKFLWHSFAQWR